MLRWAVLLAAVLPAGCSLLGYYDEPPTECPEDARCCSSGDPLAHGGCDWTCNDPEAPDLRLAALKVSAGAPESVPFRTGLEGAVAAGGLVWLIDVEADGTSRSFRTGAGTCDALGSCAFEDEPAPAAGPATLGRDGRLGLPTAGTFDATVVVDEEEFGDPFRLRLRECTLVGPVESDGNCIGARRGASAADWSAPAQLTCKIAAEDAVEVNLTRHNVTLCDLLAGCGDLFCCDTDPWTWPHLATELVSNLPAWSLQADVAAIGVRIGD